MTKSEIISHLYQISGFLEAKGYKEKAADVLEIVQAITDASFTIKKGKKS